VTYVNWPSVLSQINSQEKIELVDVTYPQVSYRSQYLPITINIKNIGEAGKDVLIEVLSSESNSLFSRTQLSENGSTANVLINLPVRSYGENSFKVVVFWVGVGELCKMEQATVDKSFTGLAADYEILPLNNIASIAQDFDWTLNIKNIGNTPAEKLAIQIVDDGQLIVSTSGTQTIDSLGVDQAKQVTFVFSVPHDAKEGKDSITINLVTSYPDCQESYWQTFPITLQKSPTQADIENATAMIYWIIPLVAAVVILSSVISKKKR
jgi:hypothetical protein